MTGNAKLLLDSNIFIYAANRDSLYYEQAIEILETYIKTGFYVADLNLIEIFQVITDGRKTSHPYDTESAMKYIRKLIHVPEIHILKTEQLSEICCDIERFERLVIRSSISPPVREE